MVCSENVERICHRIVGRLIARRVVYPKHRRFDVAADTLYTAANGWLFTLCAPNSLIALALNRFYYVAGLS